MEGSLNPTRRGLFMILGAASFATAARLPPEQFAAPGLNVLLPAVERLVRTGREFSQTPALGGAWSGREFDFGFYHGVAVHLPDGRRHAVRIPAALVREFGPALAAKSAVHELMTWSTNG